MNEVNESYSQSGNKSSYCPDYDKVVRQHMKHTDDRKREIYEELFDAVVTVEEESYKLTNRVLNADSYEDITEALNGVIDTLLDDVKPLHDELKALEEAEEGEW